MSLGEDTIRNGAGIELHAGALSNRGLGNCKHMYQGIRMRNDNQEFDLDCSRVAIVKRKPSLATKLKHLCDVR